QRKTDAICREVILEAEGWNPGNFGDGLETPWLRSQSAGQRDEEAEDRRQQRKHARGAGIAFRQQHQPCCANEGNIDRPGQHGQNVSSFTMSTTVLLITPSTSCG